jgi:hypothetical protein
MPKLYHNSARWQVPGQQDKTAERIDVPASPAELAAWLDARGVPPHAGTSRLTVSPAFAADTAELIDVIDASAAKHEASDRCGACSRLLVATERGAELLRNGREAEAIAEWLADAPTWAVARVQEAISERISK